MPKFFLIFVSMEKTHKYSHQDISDYYDQTEIHYKRAWDLKRSLAMHYGYWREDTRNFPQSLAQMNEEFARWGNIKQGEAVLDAGCGVGGSSVFLAKTLGCKVKGITLNASQVESATQHAQNHSVSQLAEFQLMDYSHTDFAEASFDVIWALESTVHTDDEPAFLREAFRLLKPGGRLIIAGYFKREGTLTNKESDMLARWLNTWAISDLPRGSELQKMMNAAGFHNIRFQDISKQVQRSAWRMYYGSFYMTVLSGLYRIYNPKVRPFADKHYLGLRLQYPTFKRGVWNYQFAYAEKPA